jgi:hypothetical protein
MLLAQVLMVLAFSTCAMPLAGAGEAVGIYLGGKMLMGEGRKRIKPSMRNLLLNTITKNH